MRKRIADGVDQQVSHDRHLHCPEAVGHDRQLRVKLGHCFVGSEAWSTGGSTATSTESRPVTHQRRHNALVFVPIPRSAPTITSSIWRRIPMAIARIIRAGSPSNPRSYRWGRRRDRWFDPVSSGETRGYALTDSRPCVFPLEYAVRFRR